MVTITHPLLAPNSSMVRAIPLPPSVPAWHVTGQHIRVCLILGLMLVLEFPMISPRCLQSQCFVKQKIHKARFKFVIC